MSYWDEVKELVKKGTDIAAENIRQTAENAAGKTKEATNAAKAKTQIFLNHRDLIDVFSDLGDLLYTYSKKETKDGKLELFSDGYYIELMKKADAIVEECSKLAKDAGIDEKEFSRK